MFPTPHEYDARYAPWDDPIWISPRSLASENKFVGYHAALVAWWQI